MTVGLVLPRMVLLRLMAAPIEAGRRNALAVPARQDAGASSEAS
jgi:hypothetical protein